MNVAFTFVCPNVEIALRFAIDEEMRDAASSVLSPDLLNNNKWSAPPVDKRRTDFRPGAVRVGAIQRPDMVIEMEVIS